MRTCDICSGTELELLHRQNFLFAGQSERMHYDVVACRCCGFTFACDIPDQSVLNDFYAESEHHQHAEIPAGLDRIHDAFFDFVRQHVVLSPELRLLDIGSGIGHFLSRFQAAGMHQLLGIEPSTTAARLALSRYGIDIWSGTLDEFASAHRFGLVSLCGVLEHIADLRSAMQRISALVEDGGSLFIAVPDAASFGAHPPAEAFLEFALEHINFFSATSLDNLLGAAGFERVSVISQYNAFYRNHYLLAVYRKAGSSAAQVNPDLISAQSLRRYVQLSQQRLQPWEDALDRLLASSEPVVIWGAGGLTSRLLCDTCLGQLNIRAIVDRNPGLQGKALAGVTISAPDSIVEHDAATVVIASTTYAEEIGQLLRSRYQWHGPIVSLTGDGGTHS